MRTPQPAASRASPADQSDPRRAGPGRRPHGELHRRYGRPEGREGRIAAGKAGKAKGAQTAAARPAPR